MAITINPKSIPDPTIAYDKALINLGISPLVNNNNVTATASILITPYRVLEDGTLDVRNDMAFPISYPDVFTAALTDSDLATALTTIETAIQVFLTAKGV